MSKRGPSDFDRLRAPLARGYLPSGESKRAKIEVESVRVMQGPSDLAPAQSSVQQSLSAYAPVQSSVLHATGAHTSGSDWGTASHSKKLPASQDTDAQVIFDPRRELARKDQELAEVKGELVFITQQFCLKDQKLSLKDQKLVLQDEELSHKDRELALMGKELNRRAKDLDCKDQVITHQEQRINFLENKQRECMDFARSQAGSRRAANSLSEAHIRPAQEIEGDGVVEEMKEEDSQYEAIDMPHLASQLNVSPPASTASLVSQPLPEETTRSTPQLPPQSEASGPKKPRYRGGRRGTKKLKQRAANAAFHLPPPGPPGPPAF